MAFCAWCGNTVPQVSYAACPQCGNPTNGSQRVVAGGGGNAGSKSAGIVIGILAGGLVLVAILGILAAIAIPNFLTAMQRARQKRTMAEIRAVASAVEAYAQEENRFPEVPMSELSSVLVPKYAQRLPTHDGWGMELRYECWPSGVCSNYAISSAGADRAFEHGSAMEYGTDETKTTDFNDDILFSNGSFVQFPEGVQN